MMMMRIIRRLSCVAADSGVMLMSRRRGGRQQSPVARGAHPKPSTAQTDVDTYNDPEQYLAAAQKDPCSTPEAKSGQPDPRIRYREETVSQDNTISADFHSIVVGVGRQGQCNTALKGSSTLRATWNRLRDRLRDREYREQAALPGNWFRRLAIPILDL